MFSPVLSKHTEVFHDLGVNLYNLLPSADDKLVIFFFFFPKKLDLTFHANCLHWILEIICMKCQVYFLGEIRQALTIRLMFYFVTSRVQSSYICKASYIICAWPWHIVFFHKISFCSVL